MKKYLIILGVGIITISSCQKVLLGTAKSNTPSNNFEELWNGYHDYYGLFKVNNLNWDSLKAVYKPQVRDNMSNRELYTVFCNMLSNFNNIHVFLQPTSDGLPRYESSRFYATHKVQEDFSLAVIKHYFLHFDTINAKFHYGITDDNIGYIHFSAFDLPVSFYANQMQKIMDKLNGTKGIVIDIRNHEGGDDKVSKFVAGLFAKEEKQFMTVQKKTGPGHESFGSIQNWFVMREGNNQYTKPVILLTTRWTSSAGETFTWALKTQTHVHQLGDTTAGGFSDISARELPNGWLYFVPIGDFRNASGESEEGKGIAPEFRVVNRKEDVQSGVDKVLEAALAKLK